MLPRGHGTVKPQASLEYGHQSLGVPRLPFLVLAVVLVVVVES